MKINSVKPLACWSFLLVMAVIVSTSCSKKPAAPPATVDTVPAAQSAPSAAQIPQQNLNASALNDKVSEALAAMKAKDFKKAAEALSVSQDSLGNLTADQLAAYNSAKGALAREVISAAATGDPAAQAAMEKMRQDAMYHH